MVQVHTTDTSAKVIRGVNVESALPKIKSSRPGANVLKVGDILKINSQRLS
jgi:DNA-directed RNA polymerase subunit H (RpoH/RPB5)